MSLWKIAQYSIGYGRGMKRQTPASRHCHASTPVTRCVQILHLYSGRSAMLAEDRIMLRDVWHSSKAKAMRSALQQIILNVALFR